MTASTSTPYLTRQSCVRSWRLTAFHMGSTATLALRLIHSTILSPARTTQEERWRPVRSAMANYTGSCRQTAEPSIRRVLQATSARSGLPPNWDLGTEYRLGAAYMACSFRMQ